MKYSVKKQLLLFSATALLTLSVSANVLAMPSDVGGIQNDIPEVADGNGYSDSTPYAPNDLWWDGTRACWDDADNASSYRVSLYRNDNEVTTVTTHNTHYSFGDHMHENGSYTFRVRTIGYDGTHSSFSDYSDTHHVSGYDSEYHEANHTDTGVCPYTPASKQPGWQHEPNGTWWYLNSNGTYPSSQWQYVDGFWYYFDNNGYMMTGWVSTNTGRYYCLPSGQMATGWQNIGGYNYYFDLNTGGLWVSNTTPDGHVVDVNGVMVR